MNHHHTHLVVCIHSLFVYTFVFCIYKLRYQNYPRDFWGGIKLNELHPVIPPVVNGILVGYMLRVQKIEP